MYSAHGRDVRLHCNVHFETVNLCNVFSADMKDAESRVDTITSSFFVAYCNRNENDLRLFSSP